jgi:hypothetical protein
MIAEEKARQLFDKYFGLVEANSILQQEENAKQCALIVVDEMIEDDCFDMGDCYYDDRLRYWNDVKQEIINL